MAADHSRLTLFAALAANLAIAITKFIAAAVTHSSAMLAEGFHSVVDSGNELLMLLGVRQSRLAPDEEHPFGHGQELYFWTLIVALLIFALGGGVSVYEGVTHLVHPHPIENPAWNYLVLGAAALLEGISWLVALRGFRAARGGRGVWATIHRTKDPTIITVLLEDSAALVGLVLAFLGVFLGQVFDSPYFDGAASVAIGAVLASVALILAYESHGLLTGEAASRETVDHIHALVVADPAVERARRPLTIYLGPDKLLINLDIAFKKSLSAGELERAVERIEHRIREAHPQAARIFLEASALGGPPGQQGTPQDAAGPATSP